MPLLKAEAPDVMRPAAGFHRNDAGRKPIQKAQQPMPLEAFAKHDCSRFIQPGKTANGLAQINGSVDGVDAPPGGISMCHCGEC
jgi:hypothetical protein